MEENWQIILIISLSVCASAFFSGTEIAFLCANRLKVELDKQKGKFNAKILSLFVRNEEHFISTMLLGNNIALVLYGVFFGKLIQPTIENWYNNEAFVLFIQTLISTLIILITAEFLPKAIFKINPNRLLNLFLPIILLLYWILYIPTWITFGISKLFLKLIGVNVSKTEQVFSKIDLNNYVSDINSRMKKEFELENEIQILKNAINFTDVKARDCMIPRTEIVALDFNEKIDVLLKKFIDTGLSKILIYRDSIDNLVGFVHSFNLFKNPKNIKDNIMPVFIVPEAMSASDLLKSFTEKKKSIAVVVDEYGGTSGIVTIEDLIEEIFGEIQDEHDTEELYFEKVSESEFIVSARFEISKINDSIKFQLPVSDKYETIGGLLTNEFERIPNTQETLTLSNLKITVMEVSENRIDLVKIEHIEDF